MSEKIEDLKQKALLELEGINHVKDLESWRVHYLGKKSELTQILRNLATLPIEERKAVGTSANQFKVLLENSVGQKRYWEMTLMQRLLLDIGDQILKFLPLLEENPFQT